MPNNPAPLTDQQIRAAIRELAALAVEGFLVSQTVLAVLRTKQMVTEPELHAVGETVKKANQKALKVLASLQSLSEKTQ